MPDWIRPFAPRVAGAIVAAIVTWLAAKFGIIVPDEDKARLTDGIAILLMLIFTLVYALSHKMFSIKANPADAATSTLAAKGKTDQHSFE
jgi:hypothetical protein